jgi:hypothetical protein
LQDRRLVPAKTQPIQAIKDRIDRFLGGALLVRIFDPEQELAAFRARI